MPPIQCWRSQVEESCQSTRSQVIHLQLVKKKYCCCEIIQISRTTDNFSSCVRSKFLQKILDNFQQHDFFFPVLQREFYETGRRIAVSSILTIFLSLLFPHVQSAVHDLQCDLVICKVVRAWFHSWVTFLLPLGCWFEQHSHRVDFILKDENLVASGVGELNDCFSKSIHQVCIQRHLKYLAQPNNKWHCFNKLRKSKIVPLCLETVTHYALDWNATMRCLFLSVLFQETQIFSWSK